MVATDLLLLQVPPLRSRNDQALQVHVSQGWQQHGLLKGGQRDDRVQTANELRSQAEGKQIIGRGGLLRMAAAACHRFLKAGKAAAADEQDARSIESETLEQGFLIPALKHLNQGRDAVRTVDAVDVDQAAFGGLDVIVRGFQQPEEKRLANCVR